MLGALSSPHTASVAQLDRVSVSEAEGRGFDSRRARHKLQSVSDPAFPFYFSAVAIFVPISAILAVACARCSDAK